MRVLSVSETNIYVQFIVVTKISTTTAIPTFQIIHKKTEFEEYYYVFPVGDEKNE